MRAQGVAIRAGLLGWMVAAMASGCGKSREGEATGAPPQREEEATVEAEPARSTARAATDALPKEFASLAAESLRSRFRFVRDGASVATTGDAEGLQQGVYRMPNGLYTLPVCPLTFGKVDVKARTGITSTLTMVDDHDWAVGLIATRIRPEYPKDERLLIDKILGDARTYSGSRGVSHRLANVGGRNLIELTNETPGYFGRSDLFDLLIGYGTSNQSRATCRVDRHFVEQAHYFQLVTVALRVQPDDQACEAAQELSDWVLAHLKTYPADPEPLRPAAEPAVASQRAEGPEDPWKGLPELPVGPALPGTEGGCSFTFVNDSDVALSGAWLRRPRFAHWRIDAHQGGGGINLNDPCPQVAEIAWRRDGEIERAQVSLGKQLPRGKRVDQVVFVVRGAGGVDVRLRLEDRSEIVPSENGADRSRRLAWSDYQQAVMRHDDRGAAALLPLLVGAPASGPFAPKPLTFAVKHSRVDLVRAALGSGADANENDGRAAITIAAGLGALDVVRLLVKAGASVNPPGAGPLEAAANEGDLATVKFLLDQGADPNAKDGGQSPLASAIRSREIEVGRALLAAGADPEGTIAGGTMVEFGRRMNVSDEYQRLLEAAAAQ